MIITIIVAIILGCISSYRAGAYGTKGVCAISVSVFTALIVGTDDSKTLHMLIATIGFGLIISIYFAAHDCRKK